MQLTVKEALSIYPLSEARVVAGAEGVARVIKSVNVMDAPDIADWMKSGEMLFTTAFVMKDSSEDAVHLLRKLNERGCAALGIKLGRFWESIPQKFLDEADRLKLPILELPFQFTFSDQMNALFKADHDRNTLNLHMIVYKQKKLMQFALNQEQRPDIFPRLAEVLEYPIAVVGARGQVLYQNSEIAVEEVIKGWPWKNVSQRLRCSLGTMHRIPMLLKDELYGYLIVVTENTILHKTEEELFQQAADVLVYFMDMTCREPINSMHQDQLRNLMLQYLSRNLSSEQLKERSQALGMELFEGPYQCVLTTMEPEAFSSNKVMKHIHQELHYNSWGQPGTGYHLLTNEGIFSIYNCPATRDYGDELSHYYLSRFHDLIKGNKNDPLASVPRFWISKMKENLDDLREAYQECLDTRKLANRFGMKGAVLQFETLEFAYVFQHVPESIMSNFCDKVLSPLLTKDGDPNQVLIHTLEAFVENDGLINEAAKQLFVHRNTVTYRMEKIASLLHMDFKKVDDLVKLKMAFTFRKFLKENSVFSQSR